MFSSAEGDQFDLSALLSAAYNGGAGEAVRSLVRVVEGDLYSTLQVDVDGTGNAAQWVTVANLDNVHQGHTVNVILDAAQSAGTTITLQGNYGITGDFNGDGMSDILWRNDNGYVGMWEMNGTQVQTGVGVAGQSTDWNVVGIGDFNGDGNDDILWRKDDGYVGMWEMNGPRFKPEWVSPRSQPTGMW